MTPQGRIIMQDLKHCVPKFSSPSVWAFKHSGCIRPGYVRGRCCVRLQDLQFYFNLSRKIFLSSSCYSLFECILMSLGQFQVAKGPLSIQRGSNLRFPHCKIFFARSPLANLEYLRVHLVTLNALKRSLIVQQRSETN